MTPPGSRIGKYEIHQELGRGTFTRVYRGHDPTVGRPVAIKVLLDESDRELTSQFRQLAAAAANLHHKNIVTIYELGEHNGSPFLAMEYLEGVNLRQVVADSKRLSLLQKMLIMWQVAEAVQCSHQHEAVHLDLRPESIILLPDGLVKMLDFRVIRAGEQDLLYRPPEHLHAPMPPDKPGDIFIYGIVYYELLAGRHPFAGGDLRATMTRIARDEPPPLTAASNCPETLERAIRRALEKDSELRYPSIEDAQFDIEPVLGELKRQRAGALLAEARRLVAEEQLDPARGVLREALELEAGNREARQLLERIREQQQRQVIRKRVEALAEDAEQALQGRRFEEAVEALEAALRLDASAVEVRARLDQSRQWLEQSRRAAALVGEARQYVQQQKLEQAREKILDALQSDPQEPEAIRLLDRVDKEIAERDRQRHLQEGLVKAQCLVLAESFDEAITVLTQLQAEHAGSRQVQERLAEARRDKAARERQQRLEAGLEAARELIGLQRLPEAIERLEALSQEFGGEADVRKMLADAREELQKQERNRAIEKVRNQAMSLSAGGDFVGAIEVLAHGLRSFPEAVDLRRVLRVLEDTAMDLSSKISRDPPVEPELETQRFIQDTLARVSILEDRQQWRTALTVLEQALERCPNSGDLALVHSRIKARSSDAERRQKIGRRIEVIEQKISEQAWLPAILLIEASLAEFPGEADLKRLLERAQAARQFSDCENVIASIQQSLSDGDLDQSANLLQTAAEAYPTDPRLPSLRHELEREKTYRSQFHEAEMHFSRQRFEEAETILLDLKARKPADPDVLALLETVRLERVPEEDRQYYNQGREQAMAYVRSRELDRALAVLQRLLSRFPDDSVLMRDMALVLSAKAQEQGAQPEAASSDLTLPQGMNPLVPVKRPPERTIFSGQSGGAEKRIALIAIPLLFIVLLIVFLIWKAH